MKEQPKRQSKLERVNLYLDREMEALEEANFLKDIKNDSEFEATLTAEQSLRERMRDAVSRSKPSARLVQAIKEKIRIAPV